MRLVSDKVEIRQGLEDKRIHALERICDFLGEVRRRLEGHLGGELVVVLKLTEGVRGSGRHVSPVERVFGNLEPVFGFDIFEDVFNRLSRSTERSAKNNGSQKKSRHGTENNRLTGNRQFQTHTDSSSKPPFPSTLSSAATKQATRVVAACCRYWDPCRPA